MSSWSPQERHCYSASLQNEEAIFSGNIYVIVVKGIVFSTVSVSSGVCNGIIIIKSSNGSSCKREPQLAGSFFSSQTVALVLPRLLLA